jgi:hypothetical protein
MFLLFLNLLFLLFVLLRPSKCTGREIPQSVEDHVADVLAHVDETELTVEEEDTEFKICGKISRFQSRLILFAKAEFGLLRRSQANRLMVRKDLRDLMRDRGVRPSHIAAHLDTAVAIFFIPSKKDVSNHQVGASALANERDDLVTTQWESIFGGVSRMLGFPES